MLIVQSADLTEVRPAAWLAATLADILGSRAHLVVDAHIGDDRVDLLVLSSDGIVLLDVPDAVVRSSPSGWMAGSGEGWEPYRGRPPEDVAALADRLREVTGLRSAGGMAVPADLERALPPVLLTASDLSDPQACIERMLAAVPGTAPGDLVDAALAALVGEDPLEDDPATVLADLQGWRPAPAPPLPAFSPQPHLHRQVEPGRRQASSPSRAHAPAPRPVRPPAPVPTAEVVERADGDLERRRMDAARQRDAAAGRAASQAEARQRWPLAPDLPLRLPVATEDVATVRGEEIRDALPHWPLGDLRDVVAVTVAALTAAERGSAEWADLDRGLAVLREEGRRRRVVLGLPGGRRPARTNTRRLALQRALEPHVLDHAAAAVRLLTALGAGADPATLDVQQYARLRPDGDADAALAAVRAALDVV